MDLELVPHDLYGWMIAGDPQPPPEVVSVWVMRPSETTSLEPTLQIPLPTVLADGRTVKFQSLWCAIDAIEANLVYHPYWAIDHPLERDGRALRLWPRNDQEWLDPSTLPPVPSSTTSWLEGLRVSFLPGTYGVMHFPPLSPELTLPDP